MSGNFIKIAIALLVIVGLYYYIKHKIGERQAHIVNAVIGEALKEDAVFIGSLLPALCQEDDKISFIITALLAESPENEYDSIQFNRELTRLVRNFPSRLAKATPVNNWQKSFKASIEPCLKDLKQIPPDKNLNSGESKEIFEQIKTCIEANIEENSSLKVEVVSHFSNRVLKNITNNYNSFTDKMAVSFLTSGTILIEGKDALLIYENLKKEFFNSPEFKEAYNNGCLKQLDEMTESLVMLYFLKNRDLFN